MGLPNLPGDLTSPIPNDPFYYPDSNYLDGAYSPVIVGEGLRIEGDYLKTAVNNAIVILEDTTFYVAIDGSDTEGDGSVEKPWATPHKAMEALSGVLIRDTARVTISVGEGEWVFTEPLNVEHPYGSQITIVGQGSDDRPPLAGLSQNVYGYNPTAKVINEQVIKEYRTTVWYFSGCNGVEAFSVSGVTLDKLMIAGLVDTENTAGICMGTVDSKVTPFSTAYRVTPSSASINLGQVAIFNFYMAGVLCVGGRAQFLPNKGVVCSCGDNGGYFGGGLLAVANGVIDPGSCWISNNQWGWAAGDGGFIAGGTAVVNGNQNGIQVSGNGGADITSGTVNNNVDVNYRIANGGLIRAVNVNSQTNTLGNFAEIVAAGFMDLRNYVLPAGAVFDPPVDTVAGLALIRTV